MGVALAAVADDRDRLAGQRGGVRVAVVVHLRCHRLIASSMDPRAPGHHDGAGADHFLDAVVANERDERVDLGLGAGDLHDHRAVGQVHDPAARQLDEAQDLGPVRLGGADLHERELVLDGRLGRDVLDLEHVDQPVQLLGGLLDRDVVAVQRDRHPADVARGRCG